MKITELAIQPELDEVRMDPTAFAQAVEQGHAAGVLVGFEFEVHVPAATLNNRPAVPDEDPEAALLRQFPILVEQYFDHSGFDEMTPKDFDKLFGFKQAINGFTSMRSAYEPMLQARLGAIRELFDQLPVVVRTKTLKKMSNRYTGNQIPSNLNVKDQLNFFNKFGNYVYYDFRNADVNRLAMKIMQASSHDDWDELLSFVATGKIVDSYQRSDATRLLTGDFLTHFDLKMPISRIWKKMDLDEWLDGDDDGYDEDSHYLQVTKVLPTALEQMTGRTVTVFHSYHAAKKNLTDWYIEPDGSLEADNDSDGSCEIVSPPMPALDAMDSLNKFYALAKQLHLYTNNTTGLHINVSIPRDLDVLKLAVFLGDQYVLKYFDRENNSYAASVLKSLGNVADQGLNTTVQKKQKDVFGRPAQTSGLDTKLLNKLANAMSSQHTASISYNGKYISFRHAGGNYLNDLQGIKNAVGRFVRAMIIASDPNAYVQEYKTKLVKLTQQGTVGKATPNATALINHLRTKGSPALTISIAIVKDHTTTEKLLNKILKNLDIKGKVTLTVIQSGNQVRQALINRAQRPETKEKLNRLQENSFVTYLVVPTTADSLLKINNSRTNDSIQSVNNNNYNTAGYTMIKQSILEPSNPQVQNLVKQLLKSIYKK